MKTRKPSVSVDLSMYHSMIKVRAENKVLLPSHHVPQVLSCCLSASEEVAGWICKNPGSLVALGGGFNLGFPSHVSGGDYSTVLCQRLSGCQSLLSSHLSTLFIILLLYKMAGVVRQPIDVQSLERYISKTVPEIQVPIDVKQVGFMHTSLYYIYNSI